MHVLLYYTTKFNQIHALLQRLGPNHSAYMVFHTLTSKQFIDLMIPHAAAKNRSITSLVFLR